MQAAVDSTSGSLICDSRFAVPGATMLGMGFIYRRFKNSFRWAEGVQEPQDAGCCRLDFGEPHLRFAIRGSGRHYAGDGVPQRRSGDSEKRRPLRRASSRPPDWCCAHGSAVRSGTRRGCDAAHPVHGMTVAIHQRVDTEAPSKGRGPPQGRWLRQPVLPQEVKDCGVGLVFEPGR